LPWDSPKSEHPAFIYDAVVPAGVDDLVIITRPLVPMYDPTVFEVTEDDIDNNFDCF